jgi:hypothetical protein
MNGEANDPKFGDVCGIFKIIIDQFIEGGERERIRRMGRYDMEDAVEDMFKEFSVGTFEKIIEKEVEEINEETTIKLILDVDFRNNIWKLMIEEEKRNV